MENFKSISAPRWANTEQTIIDIEAELVHLPGRLIPYSVTAEDKKVLWDKLVAGEFGVIAFHTPLKLLPLEPIVYTNLVEGIQDKRNEVIAKRIKSIATIRGTTVENLNNYEAKMARIATVAQEIRLNPTFFFGQLFDGVVLPNIEIQVLSIANNFISTQTVASQKIEEVIAQTDKQLLQIADCTTLSEIYAIVI